MIIIYCVHRENLNPENIRGGWGGGAEPYPQTPPQIN